MGLGRRKLLWLALAVYLVGNAVAVLGVVGAEQGRTVVHQLRLPPRRAGTR
jgi:hypothetical protein